MEAYILSIIVGGISITCLGLALFEKRIPWFWKLIQLVFSIIFGCLFVCSLTTPSTSLYEEISKTDNTVTYRYRNILNTEYKDTTVHSPITLKGKVINKFTKRDNFNNVKEYVTLSFPNHRNVTINHKDFYNSEDSVIYVTESFFPNHQYLIHK